jgi:hypothetical protein
VYVDLQNGHADFQIRVRKGGWGNLKTNRKTFFYTRGAIMSRQGLVFSLLLKNGDRVDGLLEGLFGFSTFVPHLFPIMFLMYSQFVPHLLLGFFPHGLCQMLHMLSPQSLMCSLILSNVPYVVPPITHVFLNIVRYPLANVPDVVSKVHVSPHLVPNSPTFYPCSCQNPTLLTYILSWTK